MNRLRQLHRTIPRPEGNRGGPRDERGAILVISVLSLLVMMACTALAVDMGSIRSKRASYQHAADTGAMLAGFRVNQGTSVTDSALAVRQLVEQNLGIPASSGKWTPCVDPKHLPQYSGSNECVSFDTSVVPMLVRVKIPTLDYDIMFGMGISKISAAAGTDGSPGACDISLGPCTTTSTTPSTTTSTSSPTTTVRPPTTTSSIRPTTTIRLPSTTARPPSTTARPPTTISPPTTVRPPTTTARPTTTVRPPTTTARPTTTVRPPTTTTPPATTSTTPGWIDIVF